MVLDGIHSRWGRGTLRYLAEGGVRDGAGTQEKGGLGHLSFKPAGAALEGIRHQG